MTKKATRKPASKRMGRPPTHPTPVGLSLLPDTLKALDTYAKREGLARSMAARRVIEEFFEGRE